MKRFLLALTLLGLYALGARAQNGIVFDLLPPEIAHADRIVGVSDDGKRLAANVGLGSSNQGVLWELGSGLAPLTPQGGSVTSLSHDGESVTIYVGGVARGLEIATGFQLALPDAYGLTGISNDRQSLVGALAGPTPQAALWVGGVPTPLGFLPGDTQSLSVGVSRTGNTVLGVSGATFSRAFVWKQSSGMTEIAPGDNLGLYPTALSADGSVAVGHGWNQTSYGLAFRWTESGGRQLIAEKLAITASGVNKDGSAIVGSGYRSSTDFTQVTYFWNGAKGYASLPDYLVANGVDLLGATLSESFYGAKISADGTTIFGQAFKNGVSRVFRVRRAGGWQNAL